jgi:hypothetical protein
MDNRIVDLQWDGRWSIKYMMENNTSSAFKADPSLAKFIALCWRHRERIAEITDEIEALVEVK